MKKSLAVMLALIMVLCMIPTTALAANWNPDDKITIKVRIFNPDNGAYFVVGSDECTKGDEKIQSNDYRIPELSKFIGNNSYRVETVVGNWYFPAGDRNVGSIVNWSCNSSTATMTYWVRGYNGGNGGTGGGGTGTGSEESGSGKHSMSYTIVYHSNYPSGTDYTQTYSYTIHASYNITGRSVDIKSPGEVGFTAPAGFKIKSMPWNTKADGTGNGVNKLLYVKPNSTNHIYAQWEGEGTYYTITYKDGDNTVGTDAVLAGESTTAMGALTKEESTFKGWSETKGGTVKYSAGEEFTPNGNMTLYAVWEENNTPIVPPTPSTPPTPEKPVVSALEKIRVTAITDNMPTPPEGVTFNTASPVTFDANRTTANLLYSFTVKGTPGAKVTITDTGAKFYNNGNWVENNITVTLPTEGAADYVTYTVYGYRQFTKDDIYGGVLKNTAMAGVDGSEKLVPGEATVPAEDQTVPEPSENPNPSPSTEPSPTPTPTPGGGNGGGHSHYYPTTTPVPVIVIPPKTGDMTIWQSILHFLGII